MVYSIKMYVGGIRLKNVKEEWYVLNFLEIFYYYLCSLCKIGDIRGDMF
jgi:hypothetical protein